MSQNIHNSPGIYIGPLFEGKLLKDGKNTFVIKIGRAKCPYKRITDESKETSMIDPDYYKKNMMIFFVENEIMTETLIHRELDKQNKRLNDGKKEFFKDITINDIEQILNENNITYYEISYIDYEKNSILNIIFKTDCYNDKKIIIGNITSTSKGEKERCRILAEKELCVKDIIEKKLKKWSLTTIAKFQYNKKPENKDSVMQKYTMADFKWDLEHGYLMVD